MALAQNSIVKNWIVYSSFYRIGKDAVYALSDAKMSRKFNLKILLWLTSVKTFA